MRHAQRIALAVAEHQGSEYALATLQRTARDAGLGIDEIALAREFDSRDEHEAVLLRFVKALVKSDGAPQLHILEEAREAGWTDEQILEAVAHVALASFANLVTRAADLPVDGSPEGVAAPPGRVSGGYVRATMSSMATAAGHRRGQREACCTPTTGPWSWSASAGRARSCSC